MDLRTYFWGMTPEERKVYCKAAGYAYGYVYNHLIPKTAEPRKQPTKAGIYRLADASSGQVTRAEVVSFYFPGAELRVTSVTTAASDPAQKNVPFG